MPSIESPLQARRGPVRDLLSAVGLGVMVAVLLKWFCLEVLLVPSPSMQPLLMGSDELGVHDRVLVDKARYLWADPQRWDLAAFRAPLQQRDLYAKRVIGLPGERVAIAGGNLYLVEPRQGIEHYTVLRRPAALQAAHWREVHPARATVRGETHMLEHAFAGTPTAVWREGPDGDGPDGFVAALAAGVPARLTWTDPDGGLVDRLWDGYPLAEARRLRAIYEQRSLRGELAVDARVAVGLRPSDSLGEVRIVLEVVRPQLRTLAFAFEVAAGRARLVVRQPPSAAPLLAGPEVPLSLPVGVTTELSFAHLDDELIATCDGVEIARLDTSAFACRDGCELPDPCGLGPALPTPEQHVSAALEFVGVGELELRGLRLWRDQQWNRGSLSAGVVVDVPVGHYFVLGDNSLQSIDSRDWFSVEIDERNGAAVPPGTAGARHLRGNRQLVPADLPPVRDENPVLIAGRECMSFVDEYGDVHALRAEVVAAESGAVRLRWRDADGSAHEWDLAGEPVPFVPRANFAGMVVANCWPLPPFGPMRVGLLR